MIASRSLGGAERWFIRFTAALAAQAAPTTLAIRASGALAKIDFNSLPVHRLPFRTTWDPFSRQAVKNLIRQVQPQIVQTYLGRATRLTHLPDFKPIHLARLGGYYELGPYRHAHGWIGNTHGLCDWMIAQGLPAQRVYHIYNFAEPVQPLAPELIAEYRTRLGIPEDAWVLTSLGRMVPVKGHAQLIAALARVPENIAGRPLRLIMVGSGPLMNSLQQQARSIDQAKRIIWTGWQVNPAPYLQLADLIIFPSQEAETLGNVILEAWVWGKPLITNKFRGALELTKHGEDAWWVPCGDSVALAEGIQIMLKDDNLKKTMIANGQRRIELNFSPQVILRQYLDLYQNLLISNCY